MREFYIVARKGMERPTKRMFHHHLCPTAAFAEAARLAKKEGQAFRVFKVIGQVRADGSVECHEDLNVGDVWLATHQAAE